jgi:hypothetical protein
VRNGTPGGGSSLVVLNGDANGECSIGKDGPGVLRLENRAGAVATGTARVGGSPSGGEGFVEVGVDCKFVAHDLDVGGASPGTIRLLADSSELIVTGSAVINQGGRIEGVGTFEGPRFINAGGFVSPGLSPGTLTINGDYEQTGTGVLGIKSAGSDASQGTLLHVTGNAALGGIVAIAFVDGYLPQAGDAFPFVQVEGATTGAFERIKIGGVAEGLAFATSAAGGALTFTALSNARACSGAPGGNGLAACEVCDNCVDDNGDGLVDRADPDCAAAADGAGVGSGGDAAARKALGKCAATMAAVGAKLSALVAKRLQSCTGAVLACVQTKPGDLACLAKAKTTCAKATAPLAPDGSDRRKARLTIAKACGAKTPGAPPAVPLATIVAATGLGFDAEVARCAALATPGFASVEDVIACIDRATVCRASALFATRVPRAAELLLTGDAKAALLACLPVGAEAGGALGDPKTIGKPLIKCQSALAKAGAKLAARLTKGHGSCGAVMRACVQSSDSAACLTKAAASCAKATRTLPTVTGAADGKLLAALVKACGALDVAALLDPNGLGFAGAGARCAALGVAAIDGPGPLATCLTREQACGTPTLVEAATPRLRELLGRAGVTLE